MKAFLILGFGNHAWRIHNTISRNQSEKRMPIYSLSRLYIQVKFRPPHLTLTVDIKSSCPYYGPIETSSILKKAHFDLEGDDIWMNTKWFGMKRLPRR